MTKTSSVCIGIALALGACAGAPSIEDGENDSFTGDGKADAFGVEDSSPDGAAVLTLASTATSATLQDDVGLSARVAKSILDQRGTLTGGKFTNLKDLDAAKYVGTKVFGQMLHYVTDHHLFKTSFRLPLILDNENGDITGSITTYNDKMVAAGLEPFPAFVWVDSDTDYSALADTYNQKLQDLATKTNTKVTDALRIYAYSYSDFSTDSQPLCFVGAGTEVGDLVQAQAGTMVGEMYIVWGWRVGTKKWLSDYANGDESQLGDDWKSYSTKSRDVLVIYSNSDDGTESSADEIAPCRK